MIGIGPVTGTPALPEPNAGLRAQSARLCQAIRNTIMESGGSIPFSRFLEQALYTPELGYYASATAKFGAGGDFITAPELSPLFADALGTAIAPVLVELHGGDILEFGAGSGQLALDLLQGMDAGGLPVHYYILELSAEMQARQREKLQQLPAKIYSRISWLSRLPKDFHGLVLANEVLDALPVERFLFYDGQIQQARVVCEQGNGFNWQYARADSNLACSVKKIQAELAEPIPDGYVSEVCMYLPAWCRSLNDSVKRGAVLFIDYGYPRREYYSSERVSGTLVCHYRHLAHDDPFYYPGLQDISAFVDFTAVVEAMTAPGMSFDFEGYTSQAQYLLQTGLLQHLEARSAGRDHRDRLRLAQQAKTLTLPGEMGEKFKVMGFSKGLAQPLLGFTQNHNRAL